MFLFMGVMFFFSGMMFLLGMFLGIVFGVLVLFFIEEIWVENKILDGKVNYRIYLICCFYGGKVVKFWWFEIVDYLV